MGSQTPISSERSRTYWTPTMERYFIDLMLDHMNRGNRVGHTFNKQAWTDMLTVFNARFGSQYDKDVLKSRYTNLWKQFNDIKNLLGQNGFSWDENRQIVVADDCVWDAVLKVYPDARPYRTKAVLNFNDLCLIYGYTTADGRYSLSSHDIDIEDEVPGVSVGDGMASLPSGSERARTDWTPDMDQYFIELMLDQHEKGNNIDNTFNKHAWTAMLACYNAKFGSQHGKRVLRHRYKKLWKYYSDVKILLEQNGFSWDESQQMIIATDDVWDAYIKVHPHARSYRTKTLPNYKNLSLIYGDAITDGYISHIRKGKALEDDILGTKTGKGFGLYTFWKNNIFSETINKGIRSSIMSFSCAMKNGFPLTTNVIDVPGEGKESQPYIANERSRTYWTPPMDSYLIDVLLDQVYRGNKLGQTFISKAWIEMVTSFNVRFNSHHDKDVLKNRYKHLRRQYNDIKILLEQTGFTWDEKREMVIAEDNVWDAYTKEHPDARSYRVKTVPSYHKLCVIFGQENYDGRYSRLASNANSNGEIPVLMIGEEKDSQSPACTVALDIDWTPQMDRYLINLMLEQVNGGNKNDQTFNEPAWIQIVLSFSERFGHQYDKSILENRYFCLMKEYDDISNLLNQNGFAWDETQQIVTATDDVWEAYIQEHPDAISHRNRILDSYNDLCLIFGNGIMFGGFNCNNLELQIDHNVLEMETDDIIVGLHSPAKDIEIPDLGKKRRSPTPPPPPPPPSTSPRKVHKTSKDESMREAFNKMSGKVTTLVKKKSDSNKKYMSMESAIDALQAIPDIDDDLLLDACDLMEDERKAKTFLALDATLRKKWLLRKLRS